MLGRSGQRARHARSPQQPGQRSPASTEPSQVAWLQHGDARARMLHPSPAGPAPASGRQQAARSSLPSSRNRHAGVMRPGCLAWSAPAPARPHTLGRSQAPGGCTWGPPSIPGATKPRHCSAQSLTSGKCPAGRTRALCARVPRGWLAAHALPSPGLWPLLKVLLAAERSTAPRELRQPGAQSPVCAARGVGGCCHRPHPGARLAALGDSVGRDPALRARLLPRGDGQSCSLPFSPRCPRGCWPKPA